MKIVELFGKIVELLGETKQLRGQIFLSLGRHYFDHFVKSDILL